MVHSLPGSSRPRHFEQASSRTKRPDRNAVLSLDLVLLRNGSLPSSAANSQGLERGSTPIRIQAVIEEKLRLVEPIPELFAFLAPTGDVVAIIAVTQLRSSWKYLIPRRLPLSSDRISSQLKREATALYGLPSVKVRTRFGTSD